MHSAHPVLHEAVRQRLQADGSLSGRRSVRASLLMAATLMLGSIPSAGSAAIDATDPALQDLLARSADWAQAAHAQSAFAFPDKPNDWPCAVSDLELRTATRALTFDELTPAEKRSRIMQYRRGGLTGLPTISYRPVRAHLVNGACRNGRLDGPVEYLISHDVTESTVSADTRYRLHQRVAATFIEGAVDLKSPVTFAHIIDGLQYVQKNGQAMGAGIKTSMYIGAARSLAEPLKGAEAVTSIAVVDGKTQRVVTNLSLPQADGRTLHTVYHGDQKLQQFHQRNGLIHGLMETFQITVKGHAIAGRRQCFVDGEEIKTDTCEVE